MSKILVIDDNPDYLISIKALLKNLMPDCIVVTSQSGEDGIRLAKIEEPDVILLDIIMPGMDGYETCRILKNDYQIKHIPIIMLTAIKTDSESRVKGLELGADAFVSKPFDSPELKAQVQVMLRIKQVEDQLRFEKDNLEKLVQERTKDIELQSLALKSAANAIVITDALGTILWSNPALSTLTGYTSEDILGYNPRFMKSGLHDTAFYRELWETISSGKVWHNEIINKRKNGELYTEDMTITPLLSDNGEISNYIAIKENITERKELETKFFEAEKMETIGRLAGGIAHDFNNILAAIMGKAEISLSLVNRNSAVEKNIKQILSSSHRAKKLINQILTFSRQNTEIREIIYLKPIVYEVIQMIRSIIPTSIEINLNISEESKTILAEATKIHEVIMNICTNAADSMNGKGVLNLSLEEEQILMDFDGRMGTSPPGFYSILTIKDSGLGMNEEILNHIFEPFYTTKEIGKGTGLGLAVAFGIIQSYDGNIVVKSTLGKGTSFQIFLPKTEEEIVESDSDDVIEEQSTGNILFVDDEEILCDAGSALLSDKGYKVTTFTDSLEALEAFKHEPESFDIVITDQTMPGMKGFELSEEMLKIRKDIPIILCSGYSNLANDKKAIESGIQGFVSKPWTENELFVKISSLLD